MCGIIGVISRQNRSDLGYLVAKGLYQLQNRGPHSTGIVTIERLPMTRKEYRRKRGIAVEEVYNDFNPMQIVKDKGKVGDVFNQENLQKLRGFMGVGQVRYPTTGYVIENQKNLSEEKKQEIILSSLQPLKQKHFKVAMVHNGDVNPESYHANMSKFKDMGIRKATSNDLEVILTDFCMTFFDQSEYVPNEERLANSVQHVMENIKGTYSVATLVNNVGLVMFRDINGRRPLYFGEAKNDAGEIIAYAFASETVALEKMRGTEKGGDEKTRFKGTLDFNTIDGRAAYDMVKPGEMVFISKDFKMYRKQIVKPDPKDCPFEDAYFMRSASFNRNKRVKQTRRRIIGLMFEEFKKTEEYKKLMENEKNVIVVSVPRTADSAAIYLQWDYGIRYMNAIEKHPFSPRIFQEPNQNDREIETIDDHYIFNEETKGYGNIIVDDSIVRGTTAKSLIKYLKDIGSNSIHFFITFPPITDICNHAINFKTLGDLFAPGKSIQEMKNELGLESKDTLYYPTPEIMEKALETNSLCTECYTK